MYYLRTQPAANAIQFTVDQSVVQKVREGGKGVSHDQSNAEQQEQAIACSLQNKEACIMCSS